MPRSAHRRTAERGESDGWGYPASGGVLPDGTDAEALKLGPVRKVSETMDGSRLIPLADVAALLHVSRQTLYRHARSGTMPFVKVGGLWFMPEGDLTQILTP